MTNRNVVRPGEILQDAGCAYSPSCLACHLPSCVEDVPYREQLIALTAIEEKRLRREGASTLSEIAAAMGISLRALHRRRKQRRSPRSTPFADGDGANTTSPVREVTPAVGKAASQTAVGVTSRTTAATQQRATA